MKRETIFHNIDTADSKMLWWSMLNSIQVSQVFKWLGNILNLIGYKNAVWALIKRMC